MKRFFVVVSIFMMGGAAAFAYLYKKDKISPVSAVSQIWTENQPMISSPAGQTPTDIFEKIAEKFKPTVVNIHTTQTIKTLSPFQQFRGRPDDEFFRRFFDDFFEQIPNLPKDYKQKNLGSGFIISPEGYVITNRHVIENARKGSVKTSNGRVHAVRIVAKSPTADLAVLKIEGEYPRLVFGRPPVVGSRVIAMGSPAGLEFTVTEGIVSAIRTLGNNEYVQTDLSLNPGNSGGPLVNTKGEIVGIVSQKVKGFEGLGFAIAPDEAKQFVAEAIEADEINTP